MRELWCCICKEPVRTELNPPPQPLLVTNVLTYPEEATKQSIFWCEHCCRVIPITLHGASEILFKMRLSHACAKQFDYFCMYILPVVVQQFSCL